MTIYEKYGGYDFFHQCIYGLYLDMFDHPEIAYHFISVDLEWLSRQQTDYLIRAIGGPDIYHGGTMKEVHAHMGITKFQFMEIAKAFRQVFLDKGVSQADTDFIMSFVASHATQIITRKTSLIDQIMRPIYRIIRKLFGWWLSKKNSWIRSSKIK
ncbi:group 1 truncated hemoglobin [Peredibacter sp. HCB2-198]|uniref:group I truncated hemoglobin n=1 Tax=Peredibacter sp. HCB2-198 TaxID=3383025 RepID=UPI0038B56F2F